MTFISILMFIFAGMLLLVAIILYSGDTGLIRTINYVRVKDKKKYARFLGKSMALTAVAPLVAGIAGLFLPAFVTAVVLIVLTIVILIVIARQSDSHYR
ncbi:MAG: hypothetical protein Q4B85_12275 [Lachnospiraceae bacterium]|nr:hypothetical protein [Lachnospiraceae bacterium]